MELLIALISIVVFAFIIYSTYAAKNAKHAQKVKAYELKERHMTKSMDMLRSEISLTEQEIIKTKSHFEELNDASD
ncbi:hypothetical protein [Maridesulfovibrio hydrothermalis]|uniref:Phage shock protein B n=1 Tax=Maridesulfovibrio hydrothermalis AM13 = DSM 14728 TaxID=1121451 RepID=L0RFV5_9BACT|nr:hypothetical protein [Maridesulfovibrio hydrothermalis]CCO25090.1 conserved exported protein of unknown function [Maridesulfovibrio hydrothermalis AM13 = DSM 14728]